MKHIKRRIASVRSTRQITKAMDLVAASKLQRIKARLNTARIMLEHATRIVEEVKVHEHAAGSIFAGHDRAVVKSSAYLVMTSNRGLCGGYNVNVIKKALAHMDDGKNEKIIALGGRGRSHFKRLGKNILFSDAGAMETTFYEDAALIGQRLVDLYLKGEVDEVYVTYTHFESTILHEPRVVKILPIDVALEEYEEEWQSGVAEMQYEPDRRSFLDAAVPEFINIFIYGAMVNSVACEQAARMMCMDAATKNAEEIIDDLTLSYNRQRQSFITQEINEIVAGANALR